MIGTMCSRFEMDAEPEEVARRFGLELPLPAQPPGAELRPTDRALVIAAGRGPLVLGWGLPASWDSKPLINARAETLAERKTFRPLLAKRCLVPASAYFEWRRQDGRKLKNRIAPGDSGLWAFAGLTDGEFFTIITCSPAPAIAHIHGRMPVILERRDEGAWIDASRPFPEVAPLLSPSWSGEFEVDEDAAQPPPGPLFA
jgi:putative SOS response-associated peptidase YedK